MRVNMLVERLTTELQPRWKKGHPPQSTTGVASSNSIHGSQPPGSACCTGIPGNMSAIAIPSSGSLKEFFWRGLKSFCAVLTAEIIGLAAMRAALLRCGGVDGHPADRIFYQGICFIGRH